MPDGKQRAKVRLVVSNASVVQGITLELEDLEIIVVGLDMFECLTSPTPPSRRASRLIDLLVQVIERARQ